MNPIESRRLPLCFVVLFKFSEKHDKELHVAWSFPSQGQRVKGKERRVFTRGKSGALTHTFEVQLIKAV